MSDQVYKVVVVGMGKRGKHHATAFHADPRFELAGICDIDTARLEAVAAEYGNPQTGTNAEELLQAIRPDVFCFATMPNVRLPLIKLGIEYGAKLIAYEKPMAMSMREALEIRDLVCRTGVKTVVSHQHRYGEHYQAVKEIIAGGDIGRVHTVYGTASGWMMHMITHLIDYMRWYNDNVDAEWVMAQASGKGKFADNHPSPDYIAGFIQFANGVRGIIECGAGAPDVPEVDYWWRKARIGAQGTEGFAEALTGAGWGAITRDSNGAICGPGCMNYDKDMPPYIADMAKWLDDDTQEHPNNGESAFKGFEIMMALVKSVIEGGQVALPLGPDSPTLADLERAMADRPVLLSTPDNRKEYPE